MKINLAHLRERSANGGWINFAVFEARANSCTNSANSNTLEQLTRKARGTGLRIDQSALAYEQHGQIKFFGSKNLVDYLSNSGVPQWTHQIDA